MKTNRLLFLSLGLIIGVLMTILVINWLPETASAKANGKKTETEAGHTALKEISGAFTFQGKDPVYGLLFWDQQGETRRFTIGSWSTADWERGESFELTYGETPDAYGAYYASLAVRKNGKALKHSGEGYYCEGIFKGIIAEGWFDDLPNPEHYVLIQIEKDGEILEGCFPDSINSNIRYAWEKKLALGEVAWGNYYTLQELKEGDPVKVFVNTAKYYQNDVWLNVFTILMKP